MLAWITNLGMGGSPIDPVLPGSIPITSSGDISIAFSSDIVIQTSADVTIQTD